MSDEWIGYRMLNRPRTCEAGVACDSEERCGAPATHLIEVDIPNAGGFACEKHARAAVSVGGHYAYPLIAGATTETGEA